VDDFLAAPSFIAQFKGKSYRDKFRVGDDLDGIARATVTANAVASAVRTSAQRVAAKYLNAPTSALSLADFLSAFRVPEDSTPRGWLTLLLVLLLVGVIAFWDKGKRLRYGVMAIAILVLGFGKQDFVSVVHILKLPVAGLPDPYNNLFWYILAAFTLVTTLLFGRVYCGYLCPYGMLTELLGRAMEQLRRFFLRRSKLSILARACASCVPHPRKIQISPSAHRVLILLKYLILVGLIAWVVTGRDVEVYRYLEPFGTLLFFSGDALLWGILIFLIVGTLFIERFYCKYLCPLGAALGVLAFLAPFRIKRVESCNACQVCAVACPAACIEAKKIAMAECYRCGICEDILNRRAGLCRREVTSGR
jgi:polyferredoxin